MDVALFWTIVITVSHVIPNQDLTFIQLDDLFQLDKLFYLGVFSIVLVLWLNLKFSPRETIKS